MIAYYADIQMARHEIVLPHVLLLKPCCFLGCHATLPPKRGALCDIPKMAAEETTEATAAADFGRGRLRDDPKDCL